MKFCCLTDVGATREMNQDYFYASEEAVGGLNDLFIVADGMGGHKAGEFASRCSVETIVKSISESTKTDPTEIMCDSIVEANSVIRKKACEEAGYSGMGTTAVVATILDNRLIVANIGDSRLYLASDTLDQITIDHSYVQEMVNKGVLTKEEARLHPDKNIITRAIGAEDNVKVDVFSKLLRSNQRILMCTDGLTNMVPESEILKVLNAKVTLLRKAQRLIDLANQNGGKDNITIIIIEPEMNEV